jgi:hypothetical protein
VSTYPDTGPLRGPGRGWGLPIVLRLTDELSSAVHLNHPVRYALEAELESMRDQYREHPSDETRYRVVRLERLITEWSPDQALAS